MLQHRNNDSEKLIGVTKALLNAVAQVPSETAKRIQTRVSESA